jgi:hypothetical protein
MFFNSVLKKIQAALLPPEIRYRYINQRGSSALLW